MQDWPGDQIMKGDRRSQRRSAATLFTRLKLYPKRANNAQTMCIIIWDILHIPDTFKVSQG